jgi:hypothetical protein
MAIPFPSPSISVSQFAASDTNPFGAPVRSSCPAARVLACLRVPFRPRAKCKARGYTGLKPGPCKTRRYWWA